MAGSQQTCHSYFLFVVASLLCSSRQASGKTGNSLNTLYWSATAPEIRPAWSLNAAAAQYWGQDRADGTRVLDSSSAVLQHHFDGLAELADRVFVDTSNLEVCVELLRQALKLCPTCYLSQPGPFAMPRCERGQRHLPSAEPDCICLKSRRSSLDHYQL